MPIGSYRLEQTPPDHSRRLEASHKHDLRGSGPASEYRSQIVTYQKTTALAGKNCIHFCCSVGETARMPPLKPPISQGRIAPSPNITSKRNHRDSGGKCGKTRVALAVPSDIGSKASSMPCHHPNGLPYCIFHCNSTPWLGFKLPMPGRTLYG
mmetsp:Transcript_60142/g.143343  ORF Transcript_60142/g.143343 Transcript_60142/m.143343 type:complete len:153 (+) Transcript_60142:51-509(+)